MQDQKSPTKSPTKDFEYDSKTDSQDCRANRKNPLNLEQLGVTVKKILEKNLYCCDVIVLEKQYQEALQFDFEQPEAKIIILDHSRIRNKYQIMTECCINEKLCVLRVINTPLLNGIPVNISNRKTILFASKMASKINKQLYFCKIKVDSKGGGIYLQSSFFFDSQNFKSPLHNISVSKDFSQIIMNSVANSKDLIEFLLFMVGVISIKQLIKNTEIFKKFPFLKDSYEIIDRLQKTLFYAHFLNLESEVRNRDLKKQKERLKKAQIIIQNQQLNFLTDNIEKCIGIITEKSYAASNVYFAVNPFEHKRSSQLKLFPDVFFFSKPPIYSLIQIAEKFNSIEWTKFSEGGFGLLQIASVTFRHLSSFDEFFHTQKIVKKADKNFCRKKSKIIREKRVLKRLEFQNHQNIMSFFVSPQLHFENCLFSEYHPNLSLDIFAQKSQNHLSVQKMLDFMIQTAQGIKFLHRRKIIHLDIKPGNIIVSRNLRLRISDFGEAFVLGEDDPEKHQHAYTIPYSPPEIFQKNSKLFPQTDVFALGVMLWRLVLEREPFFYLSKNSHLQRIRRSERIPISVPEQYCGSPLEPIYKALTMLASKMVNFDPSLRITLEWVIYILSECRAYLSSFQ